MDLRCHPRTDVQKELRFVPRTHGCSWPEPQPETLRFRGRTRCHPGVLTITGCTAKGRFTPFWATYFEPPAIRNRLAGPPPIPDVLWDDGPGSLFD